MVDIIIPTWGQESFTVMCFRSILETAKADYRLIWVDNGSTEASRKIVMPEFLRHQHRLSIWSRENLGFVKGINLGLRVSREVVNTGAEYILIANNDLQMSPGWLEKMVATLAQNPNMAACGPITSNRHGAPHYWKEVYRIAGQPTPPDSFGGLSIESRGAYLTARYPGGLYRTKLLTFFCTLFRRDTFDKVGVLDEAFGLGLGDDDDYCVRLVKAGLEMGIVLDAYVHHHHRTTFKAAFSEEEVKAMQTRNREILRQKHG